MYGGLIVCMFYCGSFFCFKQKTAYEMRISDWSSDVCSSDLPRGGCDRVEHVAARIGHDAERARRDHALAEEQEAERRGQEHHARQGEEEAEGRRSEERRVGKEGVSTGRSRWWPYH